MYLSRRHLVGHLTLLQTPQCSRTKRIAWVDSSNPHLKPTRHGPVRSWTPWAKLRGYHRSKGRSLSYHYPRVLGHSWGPGVPRWNCSTIPSHSAYLAHMTSLFTSIFLSQELLHLPLSSTSQSLYLNRYHPH